VGAKVAGRRRRGRGHCYARRLLRSVTARLLAYGAVIAVLGGWFLASSAPSPWPVSGSRLADLTAVMAALEDGAPPLTGKLLPGQPPPPPVAHVRDGFYPAGITDDPGMYVFPPLLARARGTSDPVVGMKWLYVGLWGVALLVYPLLFRELFGSILAGIVAPLGLLAAVRYGVVFREAYWVAAWAVLALLPPLMLLARRWPRRGLAIAVVVMLAASFATSMRSQAGLPVVLAGLAVLLVQPWRWRRRAAVAVAMVAAYVAIMPVGVALVRDYRDSWVHDSHFDGSTGGHPFWHSTYIGLGYLRNDYGIQWNDLIADERARLDDPNVLYVSPRYESILKDAVTEIATDDPGFVIGVEARKAAVVVGEPAVAAGLVAAIVVSLLMCLAAGRRRLLRRYLLVVAPAFAVGLLPPVVGIPVRDYTQAFDAALLLVGLLALGWLVADWHELLGWRGFRTRAAWRTLGRAGRAALVVAALLIAVVAVCAAAAPGIKADAAAWAAVPGVHPTR
jgi:hypothetical protein